MSWVYRPGHPQANENGMVEKHLASPPQTDPRIYVISDTMDPLKHPGTGMVLDSKAEFRRHTRASGCVEVGTDPAARRPGPKIEPTGVEMDVKRAIQELSSR